MKFIFATLIFILAILFNYFFVEINSNQEDFVVFIISFVVIVFLIIFGYYNAKKSYEEDEF